MDLQTKNLLNCPDVFADVVNVNLFQGRHILYPEMLEKQPTEMIYRDDKEELRHHFLDTRMKVRHNGTDVAFLCIENQAQISNVMPVRDMGYRYSNYKEQIQKMKKDNKVNGCVYPVKEIADEQRLLPVISMVMYYDKKPWLKPRTLLDMLSLPDDEREAWEQVITSHSIHLVELRHQDETTRRRYQSDFRHIADFLACDDSEEKWREYLSDETRTIKHPEEYLDMMAVLTSDRRFQEIKAKVKDNEAEGGEIIMKSFLDMVERDAMEKGIEKGMEKGIETGVTNVIYRMLEKNQSPEVISDMIGKPIEYVHSVQKEYVEMVREKAKYGEVRENKE